MVKPRRRRSRFVTMWILLGAIVVLVAATLLMRSAYHRASQNLSAPDTPQTEQTQADTDSLFSIQEIAVSGNTRYRPEAIVQVSGLYQGESVWSVDKTAAEERILEAFPYIEQVKVSNTAYNRLEIAVVETQEIGVMYADGQWAAVGANGKVLELREITSDRPLRALYFKGAAVSSAVPGEQAMDERSFAIVTELLAAFKQYGLTGVGEIDLGNKSDLQLTWNGRITVRLGNDSNLTHEVGVVVGALPEIEAQYGANAAGQLDVSAFSEAGAAARAVFTPHDLLPSANATEDASGTTAADGTGNRGASDTTETAA